MKEIAEKYGDERRTRISVEAKEELHDEDLVHDEDTLITLTQRGYIKRVNAVAYKSQGIGGKGVTGHATKEEDEVLFMLQAAPCRPCHFSTKARSTARRSIRS
jgi:DNA gyrase subunit A